MAHDPLINPIYVTARNAESAFGIPWESLRAIAERFGVAPVPGIFAKRLVYRATDLVRAFERQAAENPSPEDDVDAELRSLGFVKSRT